MHYRRDIDGLRAIAVLPVILFHAGFKFFTGGFFGVDVFFVISGYLITGILISELEQKNFSIARFYERRMRRILPALFLVLLCCIPFAWMWMLPYQMVSFSGSILAVPLFISNILFMREEGYFDTASDLKPLIHTWSLAVEEQYYIIFPIMLFVLWRFGRSRAFLLIIAATILSLAANEWGWRVAPAANFYATPSRAWELLAGSICAFLATGREQKSSNSLSALGLLLIMISMLAYNPASPFRSIATLPPVIGTALVIYYAGPQTWASKLLSMSLLTGIGQISYSAYLWHQPLFAFARIRLVAEPDKGIMAALVLLSLALAMLTWRFVEQPFRKGPTSILHDRNSVYAFSGLCAALFASLGLYGHHAMGFPSRMSPSVLIALEAKRDSDSYAACMSNRVRGLGSDQACAIGNRSKGKIDFVVVGDSFAAALADALDISATQNGTRGALLAIHACPAIIAVGGNWLPSMQKCEHLQDTMFDLVQSTGAKKVILASNWLSLKKQSLCYLSRVACRAAMVDPEAFVAAKFRTTIREFNRRGIFVYVAGGPPDTPSDVTEMMVKQRFISDDRRQASAPDLLIAKASSYPEPDDTALANLASDVDLKVAHISISSYFCDKYNCRISSHGIPLLRDKSHITRSVAREIYPYFSDVTKP